MQQRPLIYFCFANQNDASYLDFLKKESRNVFRALQALDNKQIIEVKNIESIELDELFEHLSLYKDRLAIFHFSGHADGQSLWLEDKAANANGIAQLLGTIGSTIQLIFLNGCATYEQVEKLFQLGFKVVIATRVPINDEKAMLFSTKFYESLANGLSIEAAFNFAVAFLKSKSEKLPFDAQILRGIGRINEQNKETIPWNLCINDKYTAAETEAVLKWTLPLYQHLRMPQVDTSLRINEVNKNWGLVLDAMESYDPVISSLREGTSNDWDIVVKNFPWAISSNLRRLMTNVPSMREPTRERLKQIIQAYVSTTRFLSYTLLSQLWDTLQTYKGGIDIDWEGLIDIKAENYKGYDYVVLMHRTYAVLEKMGIEPFIPELKQSLVRLKEGGASFENYRFVESVRLRLINNDIEESAVRELCLDAENCLLEMLQRAAFMARYQMLAVKNIFLDKPRLSVAQFRHFMSYLNVSDYSRIQDNELALPSYTDSNSILLIDKTNMKQRKIESYLNLSPFLIDKSAFSSGESPWIFAYSYMEGTGEKMQINFQSVDFDVNKSIETPMDWLRLNQYNAQNETSLSTRNAKTDNSRFDLIFLLIDKFQKDLQAAALRREVQVA